MAADATAADIKSAYRQAALKTHPDVSDAPDATQQFSQLSSAYGERLAQVLLHLPCTGVAAPASHVNTYMPLHDCLLNAGRTGLAATGLALQICNQCACQTFMVCLVTGTASQMS